MSPVCKSFLILNPADIPGSIRHQLAVRENLIRLAEVLRQSRVPYVFCQEVVFPGYFRFKQRNLYVCYFLRGFSLFLPLEHLIIIVLETDEITEDVQALVIFVSLLP